MNIRWKAQQWGSQEADRHGMESDETPKQGRGISVLGRSKQTYTAVVSANTVHAVAGTTF